MYTVDIIIPTYKPNKDFFELLDLLNSQSVPPRRIILMNTEEKYLDKLIYGTDFFKKYPNCEIHHHSKKEFNHGATRNKGVSYSSADYFMMMTQDAIPKDKYLIENLLKPLLAKEAVVSYARQLPKEDCNPAERYTRGFNYPEQSILKSEEDVPRLGIKTYFCSDVCAAYNLQIFRELGGFVKRTIFNEDMIFAGKVAKAGYKIAYCADAEVYHSHNYTAKEQFHRNFDLGVSQAEHPEIFANLPSEGEGIRMVMKTMTYLWKNGYKRWIPSLVWISAAKWFGFRFGRAYKKLPHKWVLAFTASPEYWKQKR